MKSGRTFLRRLIDESKRTKYLQYRIRLSTSMQQDVDWWISYLPTWNGISVFYDNKWSTNIDLNLWTDASDWGVGGYIHNEWFSVPFYVLDISHRHRSIAWRELYAIVAAAATWRHLLRGKMVLFHCDNQAVCQIIQSGTSRDPSIMTLVRSLFFISAANDFVCSAIHLTSAHNDAADALSRGDIDNFRRIRPSSNVLPTSLEPFTFN